MRLPCTLHFREQVCCDPVTLLTTAITAGGSFLSARNQRKDAKKAANAQADAIRDREAAAQSAQRDQLRAGRGRRGSGDFNVLGSVLGGSDQLAPLRRLTGAN